MVRPILICVLMLPFLAVACLAGDQALVGPPEPGGFWSEDASGSYLGVDTRDVTQDMLSQLHLKEERGVEVTMVDQDAPAGKAGIKEHDVILSLNGTDLQSVEQLRRMIHEIPPGRTITLGISRNGQPMTIKVELADRKDAFSYSYNGKDFHFNMPDIHLPPMDFDIPSSIVVVHSSARSGLMIENLTPQLGDYFGTRNGQGVLVRSVEKGSRAEKAGFRAGDVIIRVNDEHIHDSSDFTQALRSMSNGSASVQILRDRKEQTLTLSLPERNHSDRIDQTRNLPEIDASVDLGELTSQIAKMKPELENAVRLQTAQIKKMGPQLEQQMKQYRGQERELKKQMQDMQRQIHDEIQRELKQIREQGTRI